MNQNNQVGERSKAEQAVIANLDKGGKYAMRMAQAAVSAIRAGGTCTLMVPPWGESNSFFKCGGNRSVYADLPSTIG